MKGSSVNNIKLDPNKQKIVECEKCGVPLVVGKFAKNNQTCISTKQFPSNSKCKPQAIKTSAADNIQKVKDEFVEKEDSKVDSNSNKLKDNSIGTQFVVLMNKLGFEVDANRRFKKRYAVDGGGIAVVYPNMENIGGEKPKLEWFSVIIQRAVGVNEEFRRFMPPDAASDCEVIASEFAEQIITRPEVGTVKCDSCGSLTDEFGVDPKRNKVLCIKPKNCFKKAFMNVGAEAEA